MRIVYTGGGTGGHFYPLIAVAEAFRKRAAQEQIVGLETYFMSDSPFDQAVLDEAQLTFIPVRAGKQRSYRDVRNILDIPKTLFGIIQAVFKLYALYPDVVFGKGGYASFPAVVAARILRIPLVIHESDIIPGRVNRWAAKYATKVAISYPESVDRFPRRDRIALTGVPIRTALLTPLSEDPFGAFELESGVPTLLILGGSQGAERINEDIVDLLPWLVENYQIIHQVGTANFEWISGRAKDVLSGNARAVRYKPIPFLSVTELRLAASAADLVISRAGSAIFEIALWGKPSILIPLSIARDDHQRENAYSYARTGAAVVVEEHNLKPSILRNVIENIMGDGAARKRMAEATTAFRYPDASTTIADAILSIALSHD